MKRMKQCIKLLAVLCCMLLVVGCALQYPGPSGSTTVSSNPTSGTSSVPTQPTTTKPLPVVEQVKLTFTGDCTLSRNHRMNYPGSFDHHYDLYGPNFFFQNVRHIFENDDLTVINLEGPLTTSTDAAKKQWLHKGRPEYISILTGSSIEVAYLGNNHRMDYGQSGNDETCQLLDNAGIGYCYDHVYLIREVKGYKFGFVSVNQVYDKEKVMIWLEEGYDYLRKQGCDVVIALVHWGTELATAPSDYQVEMGHELIDMGYDLVVGNHPHVLQGIEYYNGKFICYSLGNFSFGSNNNPKDKDTGLFQKTFTFVDGVLQIDTEMQFIPCSISGYEDHNNFSPVVKDGDEKLRVIEKMNGYGALMNFKMDANGKFIGLQ